MAKDATKVVVRLLPPEITFEQLEPTFGETHMKFVEWKNFQPGKRYKGEAKPSRNSRCYLQFDTVEHAESFMKDYHGHQFVDGHGEAFRAVACYAPYQKVPRQKPQKDNREGTILEDATYQEFVASLSAPKVYEAPEAPTTSEVVTTTPLLEYMKKAAKERRERLERRTKERQTAKWKGYMDGIAEEPKKPKWTCSECGTSRNLEEDPDDRGVFYCTPCWESWEVAALTSKKSKKKKKAEKERYEETWEEPEEYSTKKKKKKRGKEEEEEWWAEPHTVKKSYYEEDADARRRRKKKEKAEAEWAEADWDWSASKKDDSWWEEPATEKKKKKGSKYKESEATWWESEYDASSSGSKWRAVETTEEKPKKSKKDKKAKEESGSYWAPKSKSRWVASEY